MVILQPSQPIAPRSAPGVRPPAPREEAIDIKDFSTMFGDGAVRVLLDWAAIRSPAFRVRETFTRSRTVLGDLATVWYAAPDGTSAEYHTEGARQLTVRQAVAARDSWPARRAGRVAEFVDRFRVQGEPVHLVLPAVELPDGGAILLDGTHRTSAAFLTDLDVRLLLFTLSGPADASVLPDLAHHPIYGPRSDSVVRA
jgi:hypothetical protein